MWRVCAECRALRPSDSSFCPNCAPRGTAWLNWFRGAVGAAGLSVLGGVSACCDTPVVEVEDAGVPDAGPWDAGVPEPDAGPADAGPDAGIADAGSVVCFCPVLASYGNFGPCEGTPVAPDAGCFGAGPPTCVTTCE